MKITAPYFGNRFAPAIAKNATKKASRAKASSFSEMEALEPRILLSGVGTGLNKKNVSFFDADGDKVTVKLQGKGSFNIDLGGNSNNSDIANITLNADKTGVAGSLGVVVTPVGSFTKPVQTKAIFNPNVGIDVGFGGGNDSLTMANKDLNQKIQTQYYDLTPGYTNIGSITVATGTTQVGSIGLNAAVVPVIDLGTAAAGNINFSTGMIAKVDNFMNANSQAYGNDNKPLNGLGWTNGLSQVQVYDISAGSIAGINLSGHSTGVNDFQGTITAKNGGIGRITGVNSSFDGNIVLEGTNSSLGNVVLGDGFTSGSTISAGGDLTFNAAGFDGLIQIAGHLNLGISGDVGAGFGGTIIAAKGVSGLGATTTDAILVSGSNITGIISTSGDISDITLNSSVFTGTLEAKNIGTIYVGANSSLGNSATGTILASGNLEGISVRNQNLDVTALKTLIVGDTIGLLDVAGGNIVGSIVAKNIDAVSVRGGDIDSNATLFASGKIGTITIVDGGTYGTIIAQGTDGIGAINVTAVDSGADAINGSIYSGGGIASINATSVNGDAISANIQAVGTIGAITATSYNGAAFSNVNLLAPSISGITATSMFGTAITGANNFIATTGSVSNITATGYTGGILGNTVITAKTSIGSIKAYAIQSGDAINGLTLNAGTTVSTIEGTASGSNVLDDGIASLTVNAIGNVSAITGTAFQGVGINDGAIVSTTGTIDDIIGSSTGIGGGDGIFSLEVKALTNSVGDITGSSVSSAGLNTLDVDALTGIGSITGNSVFGNGIDSGTYTVTGANANIGAIVATTVEGIAISGASFESVGGTITSITATPSGVGGRAIGGGASFTAQTLGDITVNVTNLRGGYAINGAAFESTTGNIANILVNNDSIDTGAFGIASAAFTSAGSIGNITVTTDGDDAVTGSTFKANTTIANGGMIDITTNGANSDGVVDSSFQSNLDCVDETIGIGAVEITVNGAGSRGIVQSGVGPQVPTFQADDIKAVIIAVTNCDGGEAILGQNVVAPAKQTVFAIDGNMTSFTIDQKSDVSDAMVNAKVDVTGTLGPITITTVGGSAMVNSAFDPTTIQSVNITLGALALDTVGKVAMDADSEIVATVAIGSALTAQAVTIIGDVAGDILVQDANPGDGTATFIGKINITGDFSGNIEAGTDIGAIVITGDANNTNLAGTIKAAQVAAGTITSLSAGTVNGLLVESGFAAPTNIAGTIGAITITGTDAGLGQSLTVNAVSLVSGATTTGGTVDAIGAVALSNGESLAVTAGGNAISLGAITIAAPGGTAPTLNVANLSITGGAALTTIGAVTVDGTFQLNNSITTAKTVGNVNVGTVAGTGVAIGSLAAGVTIGTVTIATDAAPGTSFSFQAATIGGIAKEVAPPTVTITTIPTIPVAQTITNALVGGAGAAGGQTSVNGINFQLL